ncbi:MAG: hypothetical protein CMN05_06675 [Roseibacillus sp.]|nr:hypothetical protein [Roseibacillus sp.]MBP35191.1 hypothetical protein [Roseibacillus sp.]MDP7308722.1 prolyl oligopeptidase family serine peptidase [Roseibacillus sp.]HJM62407.1 prolyl oligopeptidase family serine peptidase [Roseibacillus sp.]
MKIHPAGALLALLIGTLAITHADIYKIRIDPHWAPDGSWMWYRNNLAKGEREFILVDLKKGLRQQAFDHDKLATALKEAGAGEPGATQLPLEDLSFDLQKGTTSFRMQGKWYRCDLGNYRIESIEKPQVPAPAPREEEKGPSPQGRPYRASREVSPDGRWRAYVKDHNLWVRAREEESEEIQLSTDGAAGNSYQAPFWAPNSNNLAAFRIQPGKVSEVHMVESSPRKGGRAKLHTRRYPLPGDKFTIHELNWFDLAGREHRKPEVGLIDFRGPHLRWTGDGRHFRYEKIDRGHQRFRIIEVDIFTGKHRNIIDERTKTFIWTEHALRLGMPRVNWLQRTKEILYLSEKDGHRHIYLVDIASGTMKPVTKGEFVVRHVDRVDEKKRQIWFRASGRHRDQDPYLIHFYRVNFDGTGFTALTESDGDHEIHYSPDRKFIIDTYSRIDRAPIHELRRVSDGKLVCKLEETDISELVATGWEPPEVFSAKGRDGTTDIWGIVCKPADFDPSRKYPVLEDMYAGPHDSYVPKRWNPGRRYSGWTDMGFVVIKVDGMGTANRSKAFHDVCWKNLKDAGFPDRILWHKAYAKENPWYDITRVGIHGGSAGGQSSTGALLFHPDFYKVAVSSCGCHDNRMDKASWNEQWMGYPVGPHYAESSNIDNAHRLKGRLLLIVGELDRNVPPESTLRLADALIRANKDFDLIVVPNGGHGGGGRHGDRRRKDFFRKHLLGIEPPNYNISK